MFNFKVKYIILTDSVKKFDMNLLLNSLAFSSFDFEHSLMKITPETCHRAY